MPLITTLAGASARGYGGLSTFGVPTSYESIATVNPTGGASTISFSSIPSTYTHLQIRGIARRASGTGLADISIRLNSDTGSNYAMHDLQGNGSAAAAQGYASQTSIFLVEYSTWHKSNCLLLWCRNCRHTRLRKHDKK